MQFTKKMLLQAATYTLLAGKAFAVITSSGAATATITSVAPQGTAAATATATSVALPQGTVPAIPDAMAYNMEKHGAFPPTVPEANAYIMEKHGRRGASTSEAEDVPDIVEYLKLRHNDFPVAEVVPDVINYLMERHGRRGTFAEDVPDLVGYLTDRHNGSQVPDVPNVVEYLKERHNGVDVGEIVPDVIKYLMETHGRRDVSTDNQEVPDMTAYISQKERKHPRDFSHNPSRNVDAPDVGRYQRERNQN